VHAWRCSASLKGCACAPKPGNRSARAVPPCQAVQHGPATSQQARAMNTLQPTGIHVIRRRGAGERPGTIRAPPAAGAPRLLLPVADLLPQLQDLLVGLVLGHVVLDRADARRVRQRVLRAARRAGRMRLRRGVPPQLVSPILCMHGKASAACRLSASNESDVGADRAQRVISPLFEHLTCLAASCARRGVGGGGRAGHVQHSGRQQGGAQAAPASRPGWCRWARR